MIASSTCSERSPAQRAVEASNGRLDGADNEDVILSFRAGHVYAEPLAPIRAGLWPLRRVLRVVNRPNDDTVE